MIAERKGHWLQTVGGRAFYPLDPRPEDVDIEDIAHALSHVCRFGGHCTDYYSVAEHSVRVSRAIEDQNEPISHVMFGFLHDAAEAYIGDMVWPLKQAQQVAGYRAIERLVENAIALRFGLPMEQPAIVKHFDLVLLATEKRDLMRPGPGREDSARREVSSAREKLGAWHCDEHAPLPERISPWTADDARQSFLNRFDELGGVR